MNPRFPNPAASSQAAADSDAGHPQPAPAANIFLAGAPPKGRGSLKWAVLSAFFCAASFLGLYYLAVNPLAVPAAEPAVIAPPRLVPESTDLDKPPQTGTGQAARTAPPEDTGDGPRQAVPRAASAEDRNVARPAMPEPATGHKSGAAPPPPAISEHAHIPAPQTAPYTISRHRGEAVIGQLLRQAYNAYQAADHARAGRLYRQVLRREPDNRAAHLGLGAIALRANNMAGAYPHYARLLSLDPDDTLALGGLMALPGAAGLDEGALERIRAKETEAPLLYFSLGGMHAREARWAEAERAFGEAHRLDGLNPDYAFNLAVSLDHQGRHKAALDYYNKAMALARDNQSHFDRAAATRRIASLKAFGAGP